MTGINVNPNANYIQVDAAYSPDVFVLARTQQIIVDPATQAVSVINAGPQGPPGGGGGSSAYYKHDQDVPATLWTVNHNLGVRTNVAVYDSTNEEVDADIHYIDDNTTTITFAYAITGCAVFS